MISRFGEYIPLAFLVTLVFIFGNFIVTFRNIELLKNQGELANISSQSIKTIDSIHIDIQSAESNQRGYLITQSKIFLDQYTGAKANLQKDINEINRLTSTEPTENDLVKKIQQVANERIRKLEEGIAIRDELGQDSIYEFINEGQGRDKMEETKKYITLLYQYEVNEEKIRNERLNELYDTLFFSIIIGNLLSFVFVLLSYYLIKRELAQRTKYEKGKDEFINMASHELKTPITSLKVYIQVVTRKLEEKNLPEAWRYLSKIDEQTNKLTNLIIELLDMSRIQTGKMKMEKKALNLDALIDDTVEAIQGTTKKHEIISKGGLGKMVSADRYRIYQVLVNLLTNAVKYSPKGGRVTIETLSLGSIAQVSVKDEGIGIDAKYQKKIFERLYQVTDRNEKTFPGLGIGLYISNEIVKRHGGKMWVKSKKNKGSTFYFDLPFQD